jgi:hypothetical protein
MIGGSREAEYRYDRSRNTIKSGEIKLLRRSGILELVSFYPYSSYTKEEA